LEPWLALLWVLPLATVCGFWARSYSTSDEWSAVDGDNVLRASVSYRGAIHLVRAGHNATARPLAWDSYAVPRGATLLSLYDPSTLAWARLGFVMASWPPAGAPASRGARPGTVGALPPGAMVPAVRPVAPWLFTPPFVAYGIPYWPLATVLSIPVAGAAWRLLLRARRARRGLCPGCGYDVRASESLCPECAEPVTRRRHRPAAI
jgi:hypothetical protein